MSLRIVCGVLRPIAGKKDNGSATIVLRDHTVSGDATINRTCEYGGNTHYDNEPCHVFSIRQVTGNPNMFNIGGPDFNGPNTHFENATIHWDCIGGEIEEIAYFFAGEE